MTRILAIHAHPDDVEILAGGTLALLAAGGHQITIVSMTPGDCGATEYSPEEISSIRRREAGSAAALIGATYTCAEFRDLAIFNEHESRQRVTEVLREFSPELVLTSSPVDYLCDHEITSELVRDACFAAPAPNYSTAAEHPRPPLPSIPHLYFMDPVGGVDRDGALVKPDFVVSVESTFETKKRMLAQHRSQREWLMKQHGMDDYMISMETWTREIGQRAGLACGEGFRHYRGHPYPHSPLLEELLGEKQIVRCP